ncbi:MAG: hypothetical protein NVSMB65_18940 [Chloroflexota bacterium]
MLGSLVSAEAHTVSAATMERRMPRQLPALGRGLFAVFMAARAAATLQAEHQGPDGVGARITPLSQSAHAALPVDL